MPPASLWLAQLLERKPVKIATVRPANQTARIAWALMARKEVYAAAIAESRHSGGKPGKTALSHFTSFAKARW
jgi:hypothetical protein